MPRGRVPGPRKEQPAHAPGRTVASEGFTYSPGVLTVGPSDIARLEVEELMDLYLPKRKQEAITIMKRYESDTFVRAQFAHYGVEYRTNPNSARGTEPLQTALRSGEMSAVPEALVQLEAGLESTWVDAFGLHQYQLDKHFLTNGEWDPTKSQGAEAWYDFIDVEAAKAYADYFRGLAPQGLHTIPVIFASGVWVFVGWDLETLASMIEVRRSEEKQPPTRAEHEIAWHFFGDYFLE